MYCHKCGARLVEGSNFCNVCGTNIVQTAKENAVPAPPPVKEETPVIQKTIKQKPSKNPKVKNEKSVKEKPGKQPGPGKKMKTALIISGAVLILIIAAGGTAYAVIEGRYSNALSLMEDGKPEDAKNVLLTIDWYKNSEDSIEICNKMIDYNTAADYMNSGSYLDAKEIFESLGIYSDARVLAVECQNIYDYNYSVALMNRGMYQEALDSFLRLGKYLDSVALALECQNNIRYKEAVILMDNGQYEEAKEIFKDLGDFSDAEENAEICGNYIRYAKAQENFELGNYFNAYQTYWALDDFLDSETRKLECVMDTPPASELYRNPSFALQICEVTIIPPPVEENTHTYIKIYSEQGDLVSTLFIPLGEKLKIKLPPGKYKFKTGYGWDWFGEKDVFGPDGQYSVLLFDGGNELWTLNLYYIYTLTLMPGTTGNIGGRSEDLSDF